MSVEHGARPRQGNRFRILQPNRKSYFVAKVERGLVDDAILKMYDLSVSGYDMAAVRFDARTGKPQPCRPLEKRRLGCPR